MRFVPYACELVHRCSEESDMQDEAKTEEQLITDLKALRQRVAELEKETADLKRAEEFARLRLALFEFSSSHSREELLQKTLDEVGELTNSPIGFYHFVESDHKTLSLQAWSTRTLKEFRKAEGNGMRYPVDQAGGWVDCVRKRRPVIHNDYPALPHSKGMPEGHAGVIRELVVPIMRSDQVVAILGIGNKPSNYTENDVAIASYLADIAWEITERKPAEEAFQQSERNYREIFNTVNDAIFIHDAETGTILDVNDSMLNLYGFSREEALRLSPNDSSLGASPYSAAEVPHWMAKAIEEGPQVFEWHARKKNGELFWVEVALKSANISGQRRMLAVVRDITERKRAQEAIARERTFSEDIINSLPGIFYMYDDKGKLVRWNKKHEEATGYSSEEMLGMYVLDWFSEEYKQYILSRVDSVFAEGKSFAEAPLLIKNGSRIPYFFTGQLATLDGKQYLIGVGIDITERKRSDAERTLLATAVEQAEENILVTDDRRTILYINPAFERSSGYRLEDIKGKKLRVLRSDRQDEAFYRNMKETLDRGEVWVGAIINKGKDGADFEIEGTISPLRDASGSITHFVAAGCNTSRFRKLERELYQAQKMESVGRLAGGVAHDFNNMLGIILGHAEMALGKVAPGHPLFANLQEIRKAAERSADLTRQLLAFARKQTVAPKVLDLNETVGGMLKMLRRLIGEDIDLAWLPGAGACGRSRWTPRRSIRYWPICASTPEMPSPAWASSPSKRKTLLSMTAYCAGHPGYVPGEYVLLAVSDDGCGMDKETLDNSSNRFSPPRRWAKARAWGLATVYGIVKQNNGFINVYSEPGQGTTFKIYLPRHKDKAGQMLKEGAPEPAASGPRDHPAGGRRAGDPENDHDDARANRVIPCWLRARR